MTRIESSEAADDTDPVAPPEVPERAQLASSRLNLNRLRYFVAVAQELHFGRAARRLGISQPPLSLHVRTLEEQVGAALFTRVGRRVALTASGRVLHRHAVDLLAHAERVEHVMQGVGAGEGGQLFVGCVPFAMYEVLPRILGAFRRSNPNIHAILKEGHTFDVLNGVQEGLLDVGLVWKSVDDPALGIRAILKERFAAVVPADHRLSGHAELSLADLAREPLVLPPRKVSPYHYDHVISAFANQGISPRIEYEVPTILSQIGFVASGAGIAIAPSLARRFATEGVTITPIREEMPPVVLSLVWSRRRRSTACDRFEEAIDAIFGTAPGGAPPPP